MSYSCVICNIDIPITKKIFVNNYSSNNNIYCMITCEKCLYYICDKQCRVCRIQTPVDLCTLSINVNSYNITYVTYVCDNIVCGLTNLNQLYNLFGFNRFKPICEDYDCNKCTYLKLITDLYNKLTNN
jgi:hypothetical protein